MMRVPGERRPKSPGPSEPSSMTEAMTALFGNIRITTPTSAATDGDLVD